MGYLPALLLCLLLGTLCCLRCRQLSVLPALGLHRCCLLRLRCRLL